MKRAVLVGVNYPKTKAALKGCINDVKNFEKLLRDEGFEEIIILTDDNQGDELPTKENILKYLKEFVNKTAPGDSLVFEFSGHGAQKPDPEGIEEDGLNEVLLPCDFEKEGFLSDDEIFKALVVPLPENSKLTCLFDCCHSGSALDLPFYKKSKTFKEVTNPYFVKCDAQMISGCDDHQTSADCQPRYSAPCGALTSNFCELLREHKDDPLSYEDLMNLLSDKLQKKKFTQNPQISVSQRHTVERIFDFHSSMPNSNEKLGQQINKRFKTQKPRPISGPLGEMLVSLGFIDVKQLEKALKIARYSKYVPKVGPYIANVTSCFG